MREFLLKSNAGNPSMRMVYGIQNPFMASPGAMEAVLEDSAIADSFELVYSRSGIEVYEYVQKLKDAMMIVYNLKYIAVRVGIPEWLVVQGCIPVNREAQLGTHKKVAKRQLIEEIRKRWKVDLMKRPGG